MDITPEQRNIIYLEEKASREKHSGPSLELLIVTATAVAGFIGFITAIRGKTHRTVKIEDLRRAYEGLSPEEE